MTRINFVLFTLKGTNRVGQSWELLKSLKEESLIEKLSGQTFLHLLFLMLV